jgi:hypothetical protein
MNRMTSQPLRLSGVLLALVIALFACSTVTHAQPANYSRSEDIQQVEHGDYIFQSGIPDCGGGDIAPRLDYRGVNPGPVLRR